MNTIFKQVIDADKTARMSVEEAHSEKRKAQGILTSKRQEIYAEFMVESQKEIDQKKAELADVFESEKQASEKKYQVSLDSLLHLYDSKKDEWVKTIVERCLES